MALLITTSAFYGLLQIPQVSEAPVAADVNNTIAIYEPEFLQKLFGYSLYKSYLTDAATQRFVDIINGKEYTNDYGELTKYPGIKEAIASYIYFHYVRNLQTATTGTGEKAIEKDDSILTTPWYKLVRAWNKMVDINLSFRDFASTQSNSLVYPEYLYTYNSDLFSKLNMLY